MTPFPEPPRELIVDEEITLRPHFESPEEIFRLIDRQRDYLGEFLPFATKDYSGLIHFTQVMRDTGAHGTN